MNQENAFALVPKRPRALEKVAPCSEQVLAGMVAETLALAEVKQFIKLSPNSSALLQSWCQKGEDYYEGKGVPQDYAEAAKWFRMAAVKGHAEAQYWLAVLNYSGKGVTRDLTEAAAWCRKAAEQGNAWAQLNLGRCYDSRYDFNHTEPRDDVEAAKWYRRAAEQGITEAQICLGACYTYGAGVPQDCAEAIKWYRKAGELGDIMGLYNLAYRYSDDPLMKPPHAFQPDHPEAYKWFKLAAEAEQDEFGKKLAAEQIAALSAKMSAEQVREGERRYREFSSSRHLD